MTWDVSGGTVKLSFPTIMTDAEYVILSDIIAQCMSVVNHNDIEKAEPATKNNGGRDTDDGLLKCPYCDLKTTYPGPLSNHIKRKHPEYWADKKEKEK